MDFSITLQHLTTQGISCALTWEKFLARLREAQIWMRSRGKDLRMDNHISTVIINLI